MSATALDMRLPGLLTTVIDSEPGLMISAFWIKAVRCEESTNVVALVNPPTAIREPLVNLVPTTCSVNDVPPAFTVFGFNNVIVGVGCSFVTVSVTVFDRWLFGFVTLTLIVPTDATSAARI